MRRIPVLLCVVGLSLSACSSSGSGSGSTASESPSAGVSCPPTQGTSSRVTSFAAAPGMCIDAKKSYTAKVTTDVGAFTVELLPSKAPATVNNFVFLARNHYYDHTSFHRVIKGFMLQGGDPKGTGNGGPGYTFDDELPKRGEYAIGSVAMANAGPNTNGSQFFIITGQDGVDLPPQYSLFGKVTAGMDTVRKIEADGSDADPAPPTKGHTITAVTITEK